MPTEVINPNWIQAGELGLAFVVIILCASLVLYVMKSSAAREALLMELIQGQNAELSKLSNAITQLSNGVGDIVDRLETLEKKMLQEKRARKAAK